MPASLVLWEISWPKPSRLWYYCRSPRAAQHQGWNRHLPLSSLRATHPFIRNYRSHSVRADRPRYAHNTRLHLSNISGSGTFILTDTKKVGPKNSWLLPGCSFFLGRREWPGRTNASTPHSQMKRCLKHLHQLHEPVLFKKSPFYYQLCRVLGFTPEYHASSNEKVSTSILMRSARFLKGSHKPKHLSHVLAV